MDERSQSSEAGSRVVLAVDDDMLILMNTGALLEDLGHEVIEASSAEEALDQLHARSDIAVLITDQLMPGMTGSQLIDAAREIRPDLPVILATGYGDTSHDGGPDVRTLAKPYGLAELRRAVAEAVA